MGMTPFDNLHARDPRLPLITAPPAMRNGLIIMTLGRLVGQFILKKGRDEKKD